MVKTMLPVQRNKDEYEFLYENNEPLAAGSPSQTSNDGSETSFKVFSRNCIIFRLIMVISDVNIVELPTVEIDTAKSEGILEMKEQFYQENLADFNEQLLQLKEGNHPEYNKKIKKLEHAYKEKLRLNSIWKEHVSQIMEKEYVAENKTITKEFEEKKIELKDNLIVDLEEKRKNIKNQRLTIDISGDQVEPKPAMTRKLRRRPNDTLPVPDKRRKNPPTQPNYLLDEREIEEDLREINSAKFSSKKFGNGSISEK